MSVPSGKETLSITPLPFFLMRGVWNCCTRLAPKDFKVDEPWDRLLVLDHSTKISALLVGDANAKDELRREASVARLTDLRNLILL